MLSVVADFAVLFFFLVDVPFDVCWLSAKLNFETVFFFLLLLFFLLRLKNFTLLTFHVRYRLQCTAHIHIHLNSLVSSSIHWLSRPFNWFNQLWAINHMGCGAFECLSLFWASSFCNKHLRRKVQNSNYFTLIATSSFPNFTLVWTGSKINLFLKFGNLQIIQEGYDFNGYSTHTLIFSYFSKKNIGTR